MGKRKIPIRLNRDCILQQKPALIDKETLIMETLLQYVCALKEESVFL